MDLHFYAVPLHRAELSIDEVDPSERLEPSAPPEEALDRALSSAQFRNAGALDTVATLLREHREGPVTFARSPGDLPALLRLADQLEELARQEAGERAILWRCPSCSIRYAVPVALVREVSIPCERCGELVELTLPRSEGEDSLLDPGTGAVNDCRKELARFFREAMARGWVVMVEGTA